MTGYKSLSATEIASKVNSGELSAVELTRQALDLANTEGKKLNTFITVCEAKTLQQAQSIDQEIAHKGRERRPLAGVPVAIKDNICYRDYPTTCASRMLRDFVPPYDAAVVERLTAAGAVIIGKTNMDEFAMGSSSETSSFGPVKNPVGEDLVPGGSSGGSAAVVAAGIVPVALGSDTGGSVRQPAAFCDVLGLKPTYGAVSRYGLVAYGSSLDQIGPLARNVEDLALIYNVICGHDPRDSTSCAFNHPDYLSHLKTERRFKIGLPAEYFAEGLDADVRRCVESVIESLRQRGYTVIDISLPNTENAIAMYYITISAESSSNLARYDGVRYGHRAEGDMPLAEMYAASRAEGFGSEVKRKIMLGTYVLSAGYYDQYYIKASRVRHLLKCDFERAFEQVDLIVSPTSPTPPFKFGEKIDNPLAMYLSDVYTVSANLAGIPAISVPCGRTPENLPVGVQFMAPRFGEADLFEVASLIETIIPEGGAI